MSLLTDFLQRRLNSFVYGATLPLAAFKLILRTPRLLALSAMPVAISLGLYIYVILRLQQAAKTWVSTYFLAQGWNPSAFTTALVQVGLSILLFIVGAFTFSVVTSIVASPFNDWLAEKTEPLTDPRLLPAPSARMVRRMRMVLIDILKTVAASLASVAALALSWIPVVNVLAAVLAFLLVTFQYISYPQTRRGQGLIYGAWFLGRHFFSCLGFGAALSVLFSIPLLSVFAVPLAVVGGTLLVGHAGGVGKHKNDL